MMRSHVSLAVITLVSLSYGCKQRNYHSDDSTVKASHVTGAPTGTRKHLLITPTGRAIFRNSLRWFYEQPDSRAMPAQCAVNVSDVLIETDASFACMTSELIPDMRNRIERNGGKTIYLPPQDKAGILRLLNAEFPQGRIPTGTLVAGCYSGPDCAGQAGDGHISIVGDLNKEGAVQLYHNNWWRPENNGGRWLPGMVSKEMLDAGFKRQWMPTAWMSFQIGSNGVSNMTSALPDIDDLDPLTGTAGHPDGTVTVMLMLLPQIVDELRTQNYQIDADTEDPEGDSPSNPGNPSAGGSVCVVDDPSGHTNLRQTIDGGSPVTAVIASGQRLNVVQRGGLRNLIKIVGFVHKSVTSCKNGGCSGMVTAQDDKPAVRADSQGPYFRSSTSTATSPMGILVNGATVKVIEEQDSGWLKVEYGGSVSSSYCR